MADNEPTISMAGINAPPLYRLVEDGDKTVIVTADTNTPMWVINGKIGGDTVETMTTAERTAITPEAGQLIYDTDLGVLFVGDGTTAGGTAVGGGGGGVIPGYRLTDDGTSLNFNPVTPIVDATGSNTVTLAPDHAYKVVATGGAVTLNANAPASGYWGLEGHLEIFVAGTGYVVTGANVVLANALEPDSVNNCTVRFHDGLAIISVEDRIAGYIVVSATGTTAGTLPYALTSATQEYVAFDASLNGATVSLSGSTANGEKHVVGNGYSDTILTGSVDCGTSKFTVANLSLQNVVVNGGTMTLGDAYIPNGSTVAVSGGGRLNVEHVTGNGGVLDNGSNIFEYNGQNPSLAIKGSFENVTLTATESSSGTLFYLHNDPANVSFKNVTFSGFVSNNSNSHLIGAYYQTSLSLDGCRFVDNITSASAIQFGYGRETNRFDIKDCEFDANTNIFLYANSDSVPAQKCGYVYMSGSNTLLGKIEGNTINPAGQKLTISSGAILDLTGNTNATPIAPGGAITFASGGATVLYSSGAVSGSYMMDNVTLPAGAKLTNTAVVDLNSTHVTVSSGSTANVSGLTFIGGSAGDGGAFYVFSGTLDMSGCVVSGNRALNGAGLFMYSGSCNLVDCIISGNSISAAVDDAVLRFGANVSVVGGTYGTVGLRDGSTISLNGNVKVTNIQGREGGSGSVTVSSGASINLTSSIAPGGGITVLTGGCTVNGNAIPAGTYTSIDSNGQPT